MKHTYPSTIALLIFVLTIPAFAQDSPIIMELMSSYHEHQTNITYLEVEDQELKLDVYRPSKFLGEPPWMEYAMEKKPVLVYIHGGGWVALDKSIVTFKFLPYIAKGWTVVNVNYRLGFPMQPAMVDCRCALNWVYENSDKYGFDTNNIVLSGASAGGHLSLITGMKKEDHFESPCVIDRDLQVAAIINWFGVTDLSAYERLKNQMEDPEAFEAFNKAISPVQHISPSTPPILTVHGTSDSSVPYSQATLLHEKLDEAGLPNELHTIENGKHGGFTPEELTIAFDKIWDFLDKHLNK